MVGSLENACSEFRQKMKENDTDTAQQEQEQRTVTGNPPPLPLPNPTNTTGTREAKRSQARAFPVSLNTRLEPGCLLPRLRAKLARSLAQMLLYTFA